MLKKWLWLVVLSLLFLYGCANRSAAETANNADTQEKNVLRYGLTEGFITRESIESNTPCRVNLSKYPNSESNAYTLYIEIDIGTEIIKKELEMDVLPLTEGSISLADVDGDEVKEILVHEDTGGVGGFGAWSTWVLKVENNNIRVLFENFNEFDTGFASRFTEDYLLEVQNRIAGYSATFDLKEAYREYIDNSAQLPDGNFDLDSFYAFEAKDVDADGISEILCKQYASILTHADHTGTACSVLKFDTEKQQFAVMDAWFEPNPEEK